MSASDSMNLSSLDKTLREQHFEEGSASAADTSPSVVLFTTAEGDVEYLMVTTRENDPSGLRPYGWKVPLAPQDATDVAMNEAIKAYLIDDGEAKAPTNATLINLIDSLGSLETDHSHRLYERVREFDPIELERVRQAAEAAKGAEQ